VEFQISTEQGDIVSCNGTNILMGHDTTLKTLNFLKVFQLLYSSRMS